MVELVTDRSLPFKGLFVSSLHLANHLWTHREYSVSPTEVLSPTGFNILGATTWKIKSLIIINFQSIFLTTAEIVQSTQIHTYPHTCLDFPSKAILKSIHLYPLCFPLHSPVLREGVRISIPTSLPLSCSIRSSTEVYTLSFLPSLLNLISKKLMQPGTKLSSNISGKSILCQALRSLLGW